MPFFSSPVEREVDVPHVLLALALVYGRQPGVVRHVLQHTPFLFDGWRIPGGCPEPVLANDRDLKRENGTATPGSHLQDTSLACALKQLRVPAFQPPLVGNELISRAIVEHVIGVRVVRIGYIGRHDPNPHLTKACRRRRRRTAIVNIKYNYEYND
eukprot:COSAG06_NODE_1909_length_8084_cov_66.552536_5_plen_156_part_00